MPLKSEFREVNRACWALDHNTRLDLRHELFLLRCWSASLFKSIPKSARILANFMLLFFGSWAALHNCLGMYSEGRGTESSFFPGYDLFLWGRGCVWAQKCVANMIFIIRFKEGFFVIDVPRMKPTVSGVHPNFTLVLWQTTFSKRQGHCQSYFVTVCFH